MADGSIKILFCSFQVVPDATGLSTRVSEFMRSLQNRAVVDGLTVKPPDRAHIERYFGARLMRVPVGTGDLNGRVQAFSRAVQRQVDSDEYTVIHTSDPFAGELLVRLKKDYPFKLVYDACGFPSIEFRYTDPHLEGDRSFMVQLRKREEACLQAADAVLAPSSVTRDYLTRRGVPAERITILPAAVDLKHFLSAAQARPDRIPMRLLYLGSLVSWQGLPTLLFALRDALKQPAATGVRLSVVGPRHSEWRGELEEQVKGRGIAENVEFLEPVPRDDLPRLISQYDVAVAPLEKSDRNVDQGGLVMKIAEYAAAGRPIIASDLPLLRAMVDESCATFFTAGREAHLAKAIVDLASNPTRRVQLGHAARALAEKRFDADAAGDELWKLYQRLAERAATAPPLSDADSSDLPTSVGAIPDGPLPDTGKVVLPERGPKTDEVPITDPGLLTPTGAELPSRPEPTPVVPSFAPPEAPSFRPMPPVAEPPEKPEQTDPGERASPPIAAPSVVPVASPAPKPAPTAPPTPAPSSPAPSAASVPAAASAAAAPSVPAPGPPAARLPTPMGALSAASAKPPGPVPAVAPAPAKPATPPAVVVPAPASPQAAAPPPMSAKPALPPDAALPPCAKVPAPTPAPSPTPVKPATPIAAPSLAPSSSATPSAPPATPPAKPQVPIPAPPPMPPKPAPTNAAASAPPGKPASPPATATAAPAKPAPPPATAATSTSALAPAPLPKPTAVVPPPASSPAPSAAAAKGSAQAATLVNPVPPSAAAVQGAANAVHAPSHPSKPAEPKPSHAPNPVPNHAVHSRPGTNPGDPPLLDADEFVSMSEAVELEPSLLADADLIEAIPDETARPPSARHGNSVALGPRPWLNGVLLGFAPLGQLQVPNYASALGPLVTVAEGPKPSL